MKVLVAALFACVIAGLANAAGLANPLASSGLMDEAVCGVHPGSVAIAGPEYYRINLVPTRRVPGSASISGHGDVYFAPSPFGVAITSTGHYVVQLDVAIDGLPSRAGKEYVLWVTSPSLDRIDRVGVLDDGRLSTQVEMNKYLVVVTLEDAGVGSDRWQGPVVVRGMSRSGLMHTMAGHGPFESEPCAQYGFR